MARSWADEYLGQIERAQRDVAAVGTVEPEYAAFRESCRQVERALPVAFTDAGAVLLAVFQLRWLDSEAEDGDTFPRFLRAYADVLEEQGGPAAEPVYRS